MLPQRRVGHTLPVRRFWSGALVLVLLAAGCASDEQDTTGPPSVASPTSNDAVVAAGSTAAGCRFLETPEEGEVTWIDGTNLMGVTGSGKAQCLASGIGAGAQQVQWSGDGSKVLMNGAIRTASGVQKQFARSLGLRLSRPTGKSVIEIGGEHLFKHEVNASEPKDITFVEQPTEAIYHPAGRSIVASGFENGTPVIKIADNLGRNPKVLAVGETARSLRSLAFTAKNALLFVGDHGDESHLHRLELETGKLTTIATVKAPGDVADISTSPFPGGGVAWTEGTSCGLVVEQDASFISVKDTPVVSARPIGWMPDRSLIVQTGCGDASGLGNLYAVAAGVAPRLLAENVGSAAVRAVLPLPQAAPPTIPDQAPA